MSPLADALLLGAAALALTVALGGPTIAFLRRASLRQHAYEDAPKTHGVKSGTPTMGGVLFLAALALAALWRPSPASTAVAVAGLGCGLVGLADDLLSVRRGRNRGLRAGPKFVLTGLVAVLSLAVAAPALEPQVRDVVFAFGDARLTVPHPVWYALAVLAFVATTHAVNLTDGLDGLAAGTIVPPLLVTAWLAGRLELWGVVRGDLATTGAALGFLVFNRHPAKVFMGDTGSLALGGVLAASAVLAGATLLLPIVGGVFVAEALSVIVQVASYKTTRKRIFRMSPLHHHFELAGWPETKVTQRFWTASALLALAGAAIAR